jgi:hypothetical protein
MACLKSLVAAVGVTLCAGANPHTALGGYTPVSNVVEHSQIVYDIKDITMAANELEWANAKTIYQNGRYSCKSLSSVRNLQAFVNAATVESKLKGMAFFDSFTGGTGPAASHGVIAGNGRLDLPLTFWDDFVIGALDGTGDFVGLSDTMRKTAVKKGILGVLTMYTTRELESAISKAVAGETADTQAAHAWDEGWAFYYGALLEDGAYKGKYSAWEFTMKRDSDYGVDSNNNVVAAAVEGKSLILSYFRQGLKASRNDTLSVTEMIAARDNIYRILALSSIRAALKYAYTTQASGYSAEYHMEAYAYFLAGAGWIEQASPGAASTVLDLLDFKKTENQLNSTLYCAVKAALIPAYAPLGLDCEMVSTYKKLGNVSCTSLPACPATAAALPSGLGTYEFNTDTSADSNIDCPYVHPDFSIATTAESEVGVAAPLAILSSVVCVVLALLA